MHLLLVSPNPLALELLVLDLEGLDELHVVDFDFFRDEVRLLKASLVVVVDVAVNGTKLPTCKADLGSQFDALVWS